MSSVDTFRYALTGGHRVVDTVALTVLGRAFLPNGDAGQPTNFYASGANFPRRWVSSTESGNSNNIARVAPNTVTPFGVTRMSVVNCRDEVLFGAWDGVGTPSCSTPLRDGRFAGDDVTVVRRYKVRVRVCDATEGTSRGVLCGQYPNNGAPIFKPVGQIQRNAENMRFAAFGYLMEQTQTRYGGVLRTPMKYVGPNVYDASFRLLGANPNAEWNAATGIFAVNPDNAAEGNSGVINYLNKFGSVAGTQGVYKTFDPIGELYYESLRYLQGKQPTAAATTNLASNPNWKQGFPVATTWSDPLICAAQPQYVILIGDTNAWNDKTIPGNTSTAAGDQARAVETDDSLNVMSWTQAMGQKALADRLLPLTGGAISATQAANLHTWVDGSRSNSFYMAGLSYWAKTQDMRRDNAAAPLTQGKQNVTTITIDVAEPSALQPRERQLFLAGAYGSDDPKNSPNWAMADSPQNMINALDAAFARVSSTSGSLGGGTITAGIFEPTSTGVFVPQYNTQGWAGELLFLPLAPVLNAQNQPTGDVTLSTTPSWKASAGIPLFNDTTLTDTRNIVLGQPLGGGVAFQWSNLSSAQQQALDTNPRTLQADGNGSARLNYLRGSRLDEGIDAADFVGELPEGADGGAAGTARPFRVRNAATTLGDIVNSAPVYVGKPRARISDALVPADSFSTWSAATARKSRTPAVYVGTNAGMVHGFNATTGQELFAYVPSVLLPKLNKLTHPGYKHEPFADGPLVATEAYARNAWRTVLAGGYGGGARGVFALDVTDPTSFTGSNVLWEFSAADDADMGFVTGKPIIAPPRVGTSVRWFVVVTSGVNNYGADGSGDSAQAFVFLLSLDKAAGAAWQLDSNYYKVALPFDTTSVAPNGATQAAGVYDRLGVLTKLYVGDLRGNLWRVDVGSTTPSQWAVGLNNTPVVVARDANGNRQPITSAPVVAFGPGQGYLVYFGTGRLLAKTDNLARAVGSGVTAFDAQSFYAVWDDLANPITTRAQLAARTAQVPSGTTVVNVTGDPFTYGNTSTERRGWVVDLPSATDQGERVINPALLSLGRLVFNSVILGADPCATGQSRSYTLNALQGTGRVAASSAGYLASPLLLRTRLTAGASDPTGFRKDDVSSALVNLGTSGQEVQRQSDVTVPAGAWTWRHLLNWKELRR